jgi:hypothetical protein
VVDEGWGFIVEDIMRLISVIGYPAIVCAALMMVGAGKPGKAGGKQLSEAGRQTVRLGIEYEKLRLSAMKDKRCLPIFMSVGLHATDGAGADDFCTDLHALLKKHGDSAFAAALGGFSTTNKRQLVDHVLYDMGMSRSDWRRFQKKYPRSTKGVTGVRIE